MHHTGREFHDDGRHGFDAGFSRQRYIRVAANRLRAFGFVAQHRLNIVDRERPAMPTRERLDAREAMFEQYAQKDATYRKIYEQWKKFRAESFSWFNTAEQAYASFAFRQ